MFSFKLDSQFRNTVAIASSMCGLWLLGVAALTFIPADAGSQTVEGVVNFRHQPSGAIYAYHDATGQFTVYIRGTKRLSAP